MTKQLSKSRLEDADSDSSFFQDMQSHLESSSTVLEPGSRGMQIQRHPKDFTNEFEYEQDDEDQFQGT